MASTRILVQRRKAIRNIRKITRTMELIATSKFRKAMTRALEAEAFTRKIAELAADLSQSAGEVKHPLLQVREPVKNAVLLVITSNRGLCGGYNGGIIREGTGGYRRLQALGANVALEISGKRGINFARFQRWPTTHAYTQFEDKPRFEEVDVLADRY